MRVHSVLHGSKANGPGVRTVVWLQGCSMQPHCPGCFNPETWAHSGGKTIDPISLAQEIVADAPGDTVGVTFSGGEPMNQGIRLWVAIRYLKTLRPDWTIGLFTGYTSMELNSGEYHTNEALCREYRQVLWAVIASGIDWVCYGRYDPTADLEQASLERPDRHIVGSANQWVELLTDRVRFEDFPRRSVEVLIDPGGLTTITGFPAPGGPQQ